MAERWAGRGELNVKEIDQGGLRTEGGRDRISRISTRPSPTTFSCSGAERARRRSSSWAEEMLLDGRGAATAGGLSRRDGDGVADEDTTPGDTMRRGCGAWIFAGIYY